MTGCPALRAPKGSGSSWSPGLRCSTSLVPGRCLVTQTMCSSVLPTSSLWSGRVTTHWRNQAQFSSALRRQVQEPGRLRDISTFILERLGEPLSVERIAQGIGMSRRSLTRWCREHLDEPPAELVRCIRMERGLSFARRHVTSPEGRHRTNRARRREHDVESVRPAPWRDARRLSRALRRGGELRLTRPGLTASAGRGPCRRFEPAPSGRLAPSAVSDLDASGHAKPKASQRVRVSAPVAAA